MPCAIFSATPACRRSASKNSTRPSRTWARRWSSFPLLRSSATRILAPRSISRSTRWEPINEAPPVTSTLRSFQFTAPSLSPPKFGFDCTERPLYTSFRFRRVASTELTEPTYSWSFSPNALFGTLRNRKEDIHHGASRKALSLRSTGRRLQHRYGGRRLHQPNHGRPEIECQSAGRRSAPSGVGCGIQIPGDRDGLRGCGRPAKIHGQVDARL